MGNEVRVYYMEGVRVTVDEILAHPSRNKDLSDYLIKRRLNSGRSVISAMSDPSKVNGPRLYYINEIGYSFPEICELDARLREIPDRIIKVRLASGRDPLESITKQVNHDRIKHCIGGEKFTLAEILEHPLRNLDIPDKRIKGRLIRGVEDTRLMTCFDLYLNGVYQEEPEDELETDPIDILPLRDLRPQKEIDHLKAIMAVPQSKCSQYDTYLPSYLKATLNTLIEENDVGFFL